MMDSPLLTVAEAAAYLKVSRSFLDHDRVGPARIPFCKGEHRVFYERAALDAYIESIRRRSTTDSGSNAGNPA